MSLNILRVEIDTLEASFIGHPSESVIEALEVLKRVAQETDEPQAFEVAGTEFMVQAKGLGFFPLVLKHPDLQVRLALKGDDFRVSASVRLSALGLAGRDASELYGFALQVLGALGDYYEQGLSRLDVAVDFQGWTPTVGEMQNIVCPAEFRPVYPSIERPQTFQFGKGQTVVRLYDKTAEIEHSGKAWMQLVWDATGRWDRSVPVWRIEGQLRAPTLKALNRRRVMDALEEPGALLDYALRWCQLRVPNGGDTKQRWPEDERWTELRTAVYSAKPLDRLPSRAQLLPMEALSPRLVTLVATAAARMGTDNYLDALQRLSNDAEVHMLTEGKDFRDLVEAKRRRLKSDMGGV